MHRPSETYMLEIDLGVPERAVFPCKDLDTASVQVQYVSPPGVAWPTGTVPAVTVEVSNDGKNWYGVLAAGLGLAAVTFTANGLTGNIDISSVAYLSARVSTIGASTGLKAEVTFHGRATA
jgi:hypothetical protein